MLIQNMTNTTREDAHTLLKDDAAQIYQQIKVQIKELTSPRSSLYEDVLDTQAFGLSREIDFAVRLNLIDKDYGQVLLENLESKLNHLRDTETNAL